jgi:hypothetical protein
MTEFHSFTVIQKSADLVMQEWAQPTHDGRQLSFVGRQVGEAEHPKSAAVDYLHSRLGFNAIARNHLSELKQVSYGDKIGFFFKIAIPGDTEVKAIATPDGSGLVVRTYDDLYADLQEHKLMELSRLYAERHLI